MLSLILGVLYLGRGRKIGGLRQICNIRILHSYILVEWFQNYELSGLTAIFAEFSNTPWIMIRRLTPSRRKYQQHKSIPVISRPMQSNFDCLEWKWNCRRSHRTGSDWIGGAVS